MARLLMNDEEIGLPIHRDTAYQTGQDGGKSFVFKSAPGQTTPDPRRGYATAAV